MGLEQFLTQEDRTASLEALRNRLFVELYTFCIRSGIDPDSIDYESWQIPEKNEENSISYNMLRTITRMCESLKIIDSKIG